MKSKKKWRKLGNGGFIANRLEHKYLFVSSSMIKFKEEKRGEDDTVAKKNHLENDPS
jgi:hypothetical protein